jgi:hypothetical protein
MLAAASLPARAVEPVPGSKNFEAPGAAPNYFSNEAGPFRGGAGAETTYSNPGPAVVSPYPPSRSAAAAPSRSASRHAVRSNRHVRYARYAHTRGRGGSRYAHARSARSAHRTAHVTARSAAANSKTTAAKKPAATKAAAAKKQPASAKSRPASRRVAHTASR